MEALQKMADAPLTDCPACRQPGLKKQVTAAAFKLKGTGWYETDFKNPQTKPTTATNGENTSSDAGKPSANADQTVAADSKTSGTATSEAPTG